MLAPGYFGYLADYALWWVIFLSLLVHTWCFFRFFPRKAYRRSGLALGNGLVFLCLLGIVALAAESYLRFAYVATDSFGMSLPARRWFALYIDLNSMGFRDKEWTTDKRPGVRRIAFLGDSFTYGWGIENPDDRFTGRIQAMFDGQRPGAVEVMNVAKPGWDTGAELRALPQVIEQFGLDEVVLCYVPNDIEKLLTTSAGFDPTVPPEPSFFNPYSSCLMDHLYRRLSLPDEPTVAGYHDWLAGGFADPAIWREHQRQLEDMQTACDEGGAVFRVALLPFLQTRGAKFQTPALQARIKQFFVAGGVSVVDLQPAILGAALDQLIVNRLDAHPNEFAHARFADEIWQAFYAHP